MGLGKLFTHVRVTPKGTYSKSFYNVFWFNMKKCLVKLCYPDMSE